ncbi:MAG: Smr/MutS family protein [Desulfosarcina sp.]|nr:Smr/MutS family protein [Desulfobacterales bacterium]
MASEAVAGCPDKAPRTAASSDRPHTKKREAPRRSSPQTRKAPVRRSRLGIRRLDEDADLRDYFLPAVENEAADRETPAPKEVARRKSATRASMAGIPTDRHGIPRLDAQTDLGRLFETTVPDAAEAGTLGEVLRQSLDHDARGLMKKKTGGFFVPRRLSLKEKLRRYPSPQTQLDLHGATVRKARPRTDAFIRTARTDGLFTVRIIVGKGLHSEGGAVLPDVIEDHLVALKREGLVLTYRWENRVKRKSGAVIVYLTTDSH